MYIFYSLFTCAKSADKLTLEYVRIFQKIECIRYVSSHWFSLTNLQFANFVPIPIFDFQPVHQQKAAVENAVS